MDAVRIGLIIRALRRRRRWTQSDLANRCRMSASEISRIERGGAMAKTLENLERVVEALDARLNVRILWQGEELDRLLDRDHARMVDATLRQLAASGWAALPETTFQVAGERGSIDVLAWHAPTETLLVIEIKSVVPDIQATLAGLDRKARLGPLIGRERGWVSRHVARVLVLPADRTCRRRVDAFATTFDRALPARTAAVNRWLRSPSGPLAGILFLSDLPPRQARQRVRRTHAAADLGRAHGS